MADTQSPVRDAKVCGSIGSAAKKRDARGCPRCAVDEDVGKGNAGAEPCGKRLQDCFLGGEAAGEALGAIRPRGEFSQLVRTEATGYKGVAGIVDPALDVGDCDEIDAVADDVHG